MVASQSDEYDRKRVLKHLSFILGLIVGFLLLIIINYHSTIAQYLFNPLAEPLGEGSGLLTGGAVYTGTTVNITTAYPFACNFTIKKGNNILSFPCISSYTPRINFLSSFSNQGAIVAIYSYVGGADPWKVYNPNLPSYVVNDLKYFDRKVGYIIILNSSSNFFFDGFLPASSDVPISVGYSLAGYPSNITRILPDGLESINDSFILITAKYNNETFSNLNQTLDGFLTYYNPLFNTLNLSSNLTRLDPYHGFWIKSSQSDIWEVTN